MFAVFGFEDEGGNLTFFSILQRNGAVSLECWILTSLLPYGPSYLISHIGSESGPETESKESANKFSQHQQQQLPKVLKSCLLAPKTVDSKNIASHKEAACFLVLCFRSINHHQVFVILLLYCTNCFGH